VVVLATAIIDRPMLNDWVRLAVPYTPLAACTPSRWPLKLTVVLAGQ
jgi:hypothetical protein